jgi:selenocysteine-specific elongation factor
MRVIGTAGHVDHGKSTLIEALTGTHPDRLKEEQERQMTIDLGFGWLELPDGQEIGIVDVPGHRDFLENMLAGVSGIDAALLVIAADEGVMPQTTEHLEILDLLCIPTGVIALTKIDLVPDPKKLDGTRAAIRAATKGTVLEGAPIIAVSSRTGIGLPELKAVLVDVLEKQLPRLDLGRPRLPIDRVFSMSGFGTIVTGTLTNGTLVVGEEIEVLPGGARGRIRGLQTHRHKVERTVPGSRTAVNIAGTQVDALHRGDVLSRPGTYQSTRRIDARLRLLKGASRSVLHNAEVKVFLGTSETIAAVRLLGDQGLEPGQEGWVQLELRQPLVCVRGDPFVIRWPSPSETLGGGVVVNPRPEGRHRRFDQQVLTSLEARTAGDPADLMLEAARALRAAPIREIVLRCHLSGASAEAALRDLILDGRLVVLEAGRATADSDLVAMAAAEWSDLERRAVGLVAEYHRKFPLRPGIPREELRSQLNVAPRLFSAALSRWIDGESLREAKNAISNPRHEIGFDDQQRAAVDRLMTTFRNNRYAPPSLKQCQVAVGEEILAALIGLGELVAVSPEVVFRRSDYEAMVASVRGAIEKNGQTTLAEVRDLFHTTRKYAQALLEHLDAIGVTRRVGDARILQAGVAARHA